MRPLVFKNLFFLSVLLFTLGGVTSSVNATIVQFQTVMGSFEVNLFDETTPITVANFLDYLDDGSYTDTVFHRSVDNFVIQGGGFVYEDSFPPEEIVKKDSIDNEPVLSNRRGTIAMAKFGGDPHSATSQWFINLSNNSGNLDAQNGGFTVFGQVIGDGMDVVDAIADLPRFNAGGAFAALPLRDYTSEDATDGVDITDEHLVIVTNIVVLNAAVDTAADLDPALNTSAEPDPDNDSGGGDSGGGSLGLFNLLLLSLLACSLVAPLSGAGRR